MDKWVLGLLAGLVGGAGGAFAVHLLVSRPEPATGAPDPSVSARLDRIEKALVPNPTAPTLEASPTLEAMAEDTLGARLERIERLLAGGQGRADPATDPAVLAVVRKALGEELEARMGPPDADGAAGKNVRPGEPKKQRVTLSEAARELDLSSAEEAELRRIYADSQEKLLKIIAGPDGDVAAVRHDLDEAKKDPKKGPLMMAKYMPKVLPRLGEFIQVSLEQDAAVQAALGADKAARLESGFNVIEANPLGGENEMRIEAR
jgi:hypothetical protein